MLIFDVVYFKLSNIMIIFSISIIELISNKVHNYILNKGTIINVFIYFMKMLQLSHS